MPTASARIAAGWVAAAIAATTCLACTATYKPSRDCARREAAARLAWQIAQPTRPALALLTGPCLLDGGRVDCLWQHEAAHGERDVVDIQRSEDTQCILYRYGRLICTLEGLRRYTFDDVDQFTLDRTVLCTLNRATGASCTRHFGILPGYTAEHPKFAVVEQLELADSLGLCGVFAGSELRCVHPSSPDSKPYVVRDVAEIVSEGPLTCLRKVDGTVWCWGRALGGPEFERHVDQPPAQVPGLPPVVEIDVGRRHACARDREGSVWCWGHGEEGQLGQGLPVGASLVAVPVWPQVEVSALWVEGDHSCGLDVNAHAVSDLHCWGLLPSWSTSVSVGTSAEPGPARIPAPVEPRCVDVDLERWADDYMRVNTDLDFTHHLALLGLARHDEETFWTQVLDRSVELRTVELDGEALPEQLVVAQVRGPHERHVFIRALFAKDGRWCIEEDSLLHLEFGDDDALGDRARELLGQAGRPAPEPFELKTSELFGDGRQALLLHALDGRDQISLAIWVWRRVGGGFSFVSPEFVAFSFDGVAGATYGELELSDERPGRLRARRWVDCAPLRSTRGCEPQRWEAVWDFNDAFYVETERHHWLGQTPVDDRR